MYLTFGPDNQSARDELQLLHNRKTIFPINFHHAIVRDTLAHGLYIGCVDTSEHLGEPGAVPVQVALLDTSRHQMTRHLLVLSLNEYGVLCFSAGECRTEYRDSAGWIVLEKDEVRAVTHVNTRFKFAGEYRYRLKYEIPFPECKMNFEQVHAILSNAGKIRHRLVTFAPSKLTQTWECSEVCTNHVTLASGGDGRVSMAFGRNGTALAVKERNTRHRAGYEAALNEFIIGSRFNKDSNVMGALTIWCEHDQLVEDRDKPCVFCQSQGRLFMSFPLADGTLLQFAPQMSSLMIQEAAYQVFVGVHRLHSQDIAHRDISLNNLLVIFKSGEVLVKIGDFGRAVDAKISPPPWRDTALGPVPYVAPEVWSKDGYDHRIDTYSAALAIASVIIPPPWKSKVTKQALETYVIVLNKRLEREEGNRHLLQALNGALNFDPKERPSAEQIVEMLKDPSEIS